MSIFIIILVYLQSRVLMEKSFCCSLCTGKITKQASSYHKLIKLGTLVKHLPL
jgi:hypothetical protein